MKISSKLLVGTCVAAVMSVPTSVMAQSADEQVPESVNTVEETDAIVVTGIRRAIQTGMATKRNAVQVVDAITAEDVGKLPDATVADALQRIPGVQITKNFGQGSRAVIRGLQSNLILIDGRAAYGWPLESANGFGDNVGRNFGLESFASNLFGKIEVYKSPVASQIEGGMGGVIDAKSYRARDFREDTTLLFSAEGSVGSRIDTLGFGVTALGSHKFDDRLSMLIGVSYSRDPVFLTGLTRGSFNETGTVIDQNGDGKRDIRPTSIKSERFSSVWRSRLGATANIDYKLTDTLTLSADTTYSALKIDRDLKVGAIAIPGSATITNPVFDGNYVVAGTVQTPFLSHSNFRGETVLTRTSSLGLEWKTDKASINALASSTTGIFRQIQNALEQSTTTPVTASFDYRGDFPSLTLSAADLDLINQPSSYNGLGNSIGTNQYLHVESQEKAAKLDGQINFDGSFISSIQAGVRYAELWQQRDQYNKNIGTYNPNSAAALVNIGQAGVVTPMPGDMGDSYASETGFYFPGFPSTFALLDVSLLHGKMPALFGDREMIYNPAQYFHNKEKTWAGYGQVNLDGDLGSIPVRGNVGVRVVRTKFSADAIAFSTTAGVLTQTPVSFSNSYTDVLPSGNLAFDLNDQLVLRFAASKTMARQALDQNGLAPNLVVSVNSVNPQLSVASSGNPFLKPTRLTNIDTTLEWYFSSSGYLSANVFYKDVKGFPVKLTQNVVVPGLESLGAIDYTRPVNSDSGKIKGLELSYQHTFDFLPGMLSGLGVISSFTYIDAKSDLTYVSGRTTYELPNTPLTGVSKYAYNVTGFYEKDGFNLRLSWVWRDKRLYALQSQGNGANGAFDTTNSGVRPIYIKAAGSLDASVSYDITPSLNVYFNAANLLPKESAPLYYTEREEFQWRHDIGERRFTAGFRAKF